LCEFAEGCIKKIGENTTHFKKIIPVLVFQPPANLALRGMQCNWQIEILSVDHLEIIDLAAQAGLTTYDASYLWLARKTGGELVTLDKRLLKASIR
jgi:predicted nucleic acid-binding protein